jgi:uncharacterized protein YdeI (YjbR/CyaY-like superfamily)
MNHDSAPHLAPTSRREWRAWLKRHHKTAQGVWLVYAKKRTALPSLTWQEGVEEALCFGWIDSLRRPVDDSYFKQLYTPRKPKSNWSAINKAAAERLIADGLMTAAGQAAIDAAKANGRWTALDHVESHIVPDDFAAALKKNRMARQAFESFSPFVRKQFLYRLNSAKKPETRARRIAELIESAAARHNPFRTARTRGS